MTEMSDSAWEVIDDLEFSTRGPTCYSDDTKAPTISITRPSTIEYTSEDVLAYNITDNLSGIAEVEIRYLDSGGNQLLSWKPRHYSGPTNPSISAT